MRGCFALPFDRSSDLNMEESAAKSKTVAIIGAGVAGIAAVKSCVEAGLTPICFEKKGSLGGLWNTAEGDCVPYSTITNLSKEFCCFSDFPPLDETSIFMRSSQLLDYFQRYVDHFKLNDHFRFKHEVQAVEKCCSQDGEPTQWKVNFLDNEGDEREQTFDFAIVCSGMYHKQLIPSHIADEVKKFTGKVIHSGDYRSWHGYEDQRVLVIGFGNSSGDISCELCRFAKQVWLSTGRGGICMSRMGPRGVPLDVANVKWIHKLLPQSLVYPLFKWKANQQFDHAAYGLEPVDNHCAFVINDELPNRIGTGQVIVKTSMESINDKCVRFKDGTTVEDIDVIVLCTGYKFACPMLSSDITNVKDSSYGLPFYKKVFPLAGDGTLAMVGYVRSRGPVIPMTELQARYAAAVFAGAKTLPSKDEMKQDIDRMLAAATKANGGDGIELQQVSPMHYGDEMADLIGCRPNTMQLTLTDPRLVWNILFGPWLCYQYRLAGPHSWPGARDAILTAVERTWYPLKRHPK